MQGFIFGEGTDAPTAAELQRRRERLERMRAPSGRMPTTFGEGLQVLGTALAARLQERRLSRAEDAERERIMGMMERAGRGEQLSLRELTTADRNPYAPSAMQGIVTALMRNRMRGAR